MPSEWAKQKATKIVDGVAFDEGCIEECIGDIATNLDAARAQGRREGLEEAAKIAANGSEHVCGSLWCNDEVAHTRGDVAAEIRARIEQPAAQEPKA